MSIQQGAAKAKRRRLSGQGVFPKAYFCHTFLCASLQGGSVRWMGAASAPPCSLSSFSPPERGSGAPERLDSTGGALLIAQPQPPPLLLSTCDPGLSPALCGQQPARHLQTLQSSERVKSNQWNSRRGAAVNKSN